MRFIDFLKNKALNEMAGKSSANLDMENIIKKELK